MTFTVSPTDPRDKKKYYFADTSQRRAFVAVVRFLFKALMEMEVTGLEEFPRQGPVILAANHVTNFDVFPIQFALPRPIFFMGKGRRNCFGILFSKLFCAI